MNPNVSVKTCNLSKSHHEDNVADLSFRVHQQNQVPLAEPSCTHATPDIEDHGVEQEDCIDFSNRINGKMPFEDGSVAFGTIRLYESQSSTYIKGRNADDLYPHALITLGKNKKWIRLDGFSIGTRAGITSLRVYVLPEDVARSARGNTANHTKDFRKLIRYLLDFVDYTTEAWTGQADPGGPVCIYRKPSMIREESLFYIFNTLQSPCPNLEEYKGTAHGRQFIQDILAGNILGLKTPLYSYQKRSIATMIQKESGPAKFEDPRKARMVDLYNNNFYLDIDEGVLLRDLPLYFETRGGILAEDMGYGKTLICLALVLATRGHYPSVPEGCVETMVEELHETVPSLLSIAARSLKYKGLPWKNDFFMLGKAGYHYDSCVTELQKYERAYNEPMRGSANPQRRGKPDYINTIRLCSATLIIVPPNLMIQWQSEIKQHIDDDALDVLIIDARDVQVPSWQDLVKYDVVLMSKSRFEQEYRDDELNTGNCMRQEIRYRSPLTEVRWLRVVCDEGHGFAGSTSRTNAMAMLDKMFIERRWVVSGTPARNLHGVEAGLVAMPNQGKQDPSTVPLLNSALRRQPTVSQDAESKDFERLRLIVVNFLKLQPWANGKDDKADWKVHLAPRLDEAGVRRSMPALRKVMQTLIVRHRKKDLDHDLTLPALHNKIVYIKPSYYDKLSINLFAMLLISNYVTSERTDEDYMFHPRNRHKLSILINNLNNATFYCISFTKEAVQATIDISSQYLDGHLDTISDRDALLLTQAIMNAEKALADPGWQAFSTLHEMGTFIGDFPRHAKGAWALDGIEAEPLLLGTTQTREAQRYMRSRIAMANVTQDPFSSLSGAGVKVMGAARNRAMEEQEQRQKMKTPTEQQNVGATEGPQKRAPSKSTTPTNPTKRNAKVSPAKFDANYSSDIPVQSINSFPPSQILGFASAKLTYLTNRIVLVHPCEQVIIFYNHNNIAFFIAEALELLGISHLIYANTLSVRQRAEYLAQFNSDASIKVLLMDLKQAGQGLHVASASRVYIVSPIWDAALESQAIKRAHRIGQTREVFVETLVLTGTIEEAVVRRRRKTGERKGICDGVVRKGDDDDGSNESRHAKRKRNSNANAVGHPMLDDKGMVKVLKDITFLDIRDYKGEKFARLDTPVPLLQDTHTGTVHHENTIDDPGTSIVSNSTTPKASKTTPNLRPILRRSNSENQTAYSHLHSNPTTAIPSSAPLTTPFPSIFGGQETTTTVTITPTNTGLNTETSSPSLRCQPPEKRKASVSLYLTDSQRQDRTAVAAEDDDDIRGREVGAVAVKRVRLAVEADE